MKYLFFDIECSNCFNRIGKICEFGYVLTDEEFHILKQDDIPMSPGQGRDNRFYLKGRKGEKDLELAYEYSFYFSQKEFPEHYERIKKLMEDPDTICFAYSMENDIHHLSSTCRRYKLKEINYTCYDVQRMVAKYLEKKGQMSLRNACLEIVGPHSLFNLQEHLSRDDAKMEMMIFEAICVLEQVKSSELLQLSGFAKTNSIEYMANLIKRSRERKENKKGSQLFRKYIVKDEELDNPDYLGNRYGVSASVKADVELLTKVINTLKSKGKVLTTRLEKTDCLIVANEKNQEEIVSATKARYKGKYLTIKQLFDQNAFVTDGKEQLK